MWKCKKCGCEVIDKEIKYYILGKNKEQKENYDEDYLYECTSCNNFSFRLEDIAKWEED